MNIDVRVLIPGKQNWTAMGLPVKTETRCDGLGRHQDAIIFRCVWYVFLAVLGLPLLFVTLPCLETKGVHCCVLPWSPCLVRDAVCARSYIASLRKCARQRSVFPRIKASNRQNLQVPSTSFYPFCGLKHAQTVVQFCKFIRVVLLQQFCQPNVVIRARRAG